MHRIARNIMNMRKPRYSVSKSLALLAIGAAVGAGLSMRRDHKSSGSGTYRNDETASDGPVEVDL